MLCPQHMYHDLRRPLLVLLLPVLLLLVLLLLVLLTFYLSCWCSEATHAQSPLSIQLSPVFSCSSSRNGNNRVLSTCNFKSHVTNRMNAGNDGSKCMYTCTEMLSRAVPCMRCTLQVRGVADPCLVACAAPCTCQIYMCMESRAPWLQGCTHT